MSLKNKLDLWLPRLVLSPSLLAVLIAVYLFIVWTAWISLSSSQMVPKFDFVGLEQYVRLWSTPRWHTAVANLFIFTALFLAITIALGLFLAILLDQKVRAEGFLRAVYLHPMALSFIVTGTAWKWILNPDLGLQKVVNELGWTGFVFDWITQPSFAIYCVVIAAVWQSTGFAMAIFLAGLRAIDTSIIKAAQIEGASLPRIYLSVIVPMLRPAFLSVIVLLSYISIKSFDLVLALTNAGPGSATEMPSTFMFAATFRRNQMGVGAASAIMMLMTVAAIIVPYLYSELREDRNAH
ncbi:sugar ABC transporter permease [Mesorhizobium sp. M1A.F.Ca.IN.022.07.1.1]|uniref:carbohydrate ABC transporter permease n=1 Tax=unclassified Mesorhizobium TaxID=325217 RepID=UPI000F757A60|nr:MULTISPECIES: sugar ABC transporter permease [unclassified Mesorhizobium]AZO58678.1 sugar ABC transporter permease [Mesorhizobium sp. M1A.F.Ca.IN.022.06.1.1]MCT2578779.1 sugar ABC transporter permease [Mesorhizobium sp. P13.3]MDF3167718.1 sugar ABC transporter permease [Mesorhizobium sp. P16.1]MDF3178397.1 sugar ABC transporter permease [Mesorhizobium sp. P17.1]MDF3184631.1 sugar ABC transporter permease [Mesorhizobium sp. ICCV3110.1]